MAIEKLSSDLEIISKLGDYPLADDGLEPDQFKAKFDEAGKIIKQYINDVLIPSLDALVDVDALLKDILDTTLTKADKAANAKATGTALNAHKAMIDTVLEALGNLVGTLAVTIPKDGWENEGATVKAAGVTAQNTVIVSSNPESHDAYAESGVRCTGQGAGELRFGCSFPPDADLKVNVLILNPTNKDVSEHYPNGSRAET